MTRNKITAGTIPDDGSDFRNNQTLMEYGVQLVEEMGKPKR
jgi:hypothetical protein